MKRLALICVSLLLSFAMVFSGCGGNSDEDVEGSSEVSFVSYIIPSDGANNIPTTAAFLITFDRDIVAPSAANLSLAPGISGTVSYDAENRNLLYKPSSALNEHSDYSMTVDNIVSSEGISMSPVTVNFSTTSADSKRPEIASSYPDDGQKDLGHDTEIVLKFSEPLNRSKIYSGISFSPSVDIAIDDWSFEWGTANDEEVTISPPPEIDPFAVNKEYFLVISKDSVVDLSGNSMTSDYEVQFHTLKYPVEKTINSNISTTNPPSVWVFVVGKRGGTWIVKCGGTKPKSAPAAGQPSGTITASADGQILDDVEAFATRQDERTTYSVTKGNGNRLTFNTSAAIGNVDNAFGVRFGSTSSYLIFSLTPGTAQYINIGSGQAHPSKGTFVLSNK